jgi:tRNA threonylcarbamoyl adenosine modification protein (Sua5/YciO/YrdC/YwlC family)
MSQFFEVHPDNPQLRLIHQAVKIIQDGGVVVYPTDSCYALGCRLDDKSAMERIRRIRRVGKEHHFTLMSKDLSQISAYAKVGNDAYRLIKTLSPGPYTFILQATHEVPRRLWHPSKKTIGIRIPDNRIALALLEELGEPLLSSTLILPETDLPMTDPYQIRVMLEHEVDLVIDGGFCGIEPSTVIGLTSGIPELLRQGRGSVDWLEKH